MIYLNIWEVKTDKRRFLGKKKFNWSQGTLNQSNRLGTNSTNWDFPIKD